MKTIRQRCSVRLLAVAVLLLATLLAAAAVLFSWPPSNNNNADLIIQQKLRSSTASYYLFLFFSTNTIARIASHAAEHDHQDVRDGVTFNRTIEQFPASASLDVEFANSGACVDRDAYGDNGCHFDWGDEVLATVSVSGGTTDDDAVIQLQADDMIRGDLKFLHGLISYRFRCAVCGSDCTLQIPVLRRNVTIRMPKTCPVTANTESPVKLAYVLWDQSPTGGNVAVRIEGTLSLIQGSTETTLIQVYLEGFVK